MHGILIFYHVMPEIPKRAWMDFNEIRSKKKTTLFEQQQSFQKKIRGIYYRVKLYDLMRAEVLLATNKMGMIS